jgi:hypothetical protein
LRLTPFGYAVQPRDTWSMYRPDRIRKLADHVADTIHKVRIKFSGREFPEAAVELSAELRNTGLDLGTIKRTLLSKPLKN